MSLEQGIGLGEEISFFLLIALTFLFVTLVSRVQPRLRLQIGTLSDCNKINYPIQVTRGWSE
jgi:hypothetical protein